MGTVKLEDVMFDSEPLGLAEEMQDVTENDKLTITALTDDEPETGSVVYFGLELPSSDIVETKGEVVGCVRSGDKYEVALRVIAFDKNLAVPAALYVKTGKDVDTGGRQPVWALGLKQTNGLYATVVNSPGGVLTTDQLRGLADIASGVGIVKLTHAQRVVLLCDAETGAGVEERLAGLGLRKGVLHHGIRNIRACCGALCRWAGGLDALSLSKAVDEAMYGHAANFDIKIAISDCMRNCSESYCADIGLIGKNGAYTLAVGGKGSGVPFRGLVLKEGIAPADVVKAVLAVVAWYEKNSKEKERFCKLLERLGGADTTLDETFEKVGAAFAGDGDLVDEGARLKAMHARLRGAAQLRRDLDSQS